MLLLQGQTGRVRGFREEVNTEYWRRREMRVGRKMDDLSF
jgi:hypothetical protein